MWNNPPRYLRDCSDACLDGFLMKSFDESAGLRKELREVIQEYIVAEARALFAEWVKECREASRIIGLQETADQRASPDVDDKPALGPAQHGRSRHTSARAVGIEVA